MAKKSKKVHEKNRVSTDAIVMGSGNTVPKMLKESKYPWAALLDGEPGELDFTIPMPSYEQAVGSRVSVQSSGRQYYGQRGISRRAVVRIVELAGGKYALRAWALAGE